MRVSRSGSRWRAMVTRKPPVCGLTSEWRNAIAFVQCKHTGVELRLIRDEKQVKQCAVLSAWSLWPVETTEEITAMSRAVKSVVGICFRTDLAGTFKFCRIKCIFCSFSLFVYPSIYLSLGRLKSRWVFNIKMNLGQIGWGGMELINLA
jgi:hypothetical protein